MTDSNAYAARVSVSCWGELPAEKRLRGVLRVLVDGQHVGAIWREDGQWHASRHARTLSRPTQSEHASADDALRAVIRSGFARHLGARAASRVFWTERAQREARRVR